MQGLLIFLLAIAASILYGILHDQITIRICLSYASGFLGGIAIILWTFLIRRRAHIANLLVQRAADHR